MVTDVLSTPLNHVHESSQPACCLFCIAIVLKRMSPLNPWKKRWMVVENIPICGLIDFKSCMCGSFLVHRGVIIGASGFILYRL